MFFIVASLLKWPLRGEKNAQLGDHSQHHRQKHLEFSTIRCDDILCVIDHQEHLALNDRKLVENRDQDVDWLLKNLLAQVAEEIRIIFNKYLVEGADEMVTYRFIPCVDIDRATED